jgi:hypothetical protein
MSDRFNSNPFSSRFVRPGAIAYRFPDGITLETLLNRFAESLWRGAIVGPHGSGKSTLLCSLVPALKRLGWQTTMLTLRDGKRWLPRGWLPTGARRIVVIDGFEQLNLASRCWILAHCRFRRHGLLVTTHKPNRLPLIHRTETSPDLLDSIACELVRGSGGRLAAGDLMAAFSHSQGNLREALFRLYDSYERQSIAEPPVDTTRIMDTTGTSLPVI